MHEKSFTYFHVRSILQIVLIIIIIILIIISIYLYNQIFVLLVQNFRGKTQVV